MNQSSKSNNNGNAPKVPKKQGKAAKPKKKKQAQTQGKSQNVFAPVAQGKVETMSKPQTKNLPNGDILVTHREFIQDVSGSTGFVVEPLPLNPGLSRVFPWLSQIANNYESYLFERLVFGYETQSGTSVPGSVILTVDYDPSDDQPVSKTQALAYRNAVRSPTWSGSSHRSLLEDLRKRKTYFVRRGSLNNPAAVNSYDVGKLYVCTVGQANVAVIGELFVEYTVRLITPQLGDPSIGGSVYARSTGNTAALKFQNITQGSTLDVTIDNPDPDSTSFLFNVPWEGFMSLSATGTGIVSPPIIIASSTLTQALLTSNVTNSGSTNFSASLNISALPGQLLVLNILNATITASLATFGQGAVP